jgi:hypothetical protein
VSVHQMSQTDDWSPVDECCERLRRAGWSMSDTLVETAHGPAWIVTGTDGSSTLRAIGHTQTEAWLHAWEQADAAGAPTG